MTRRMVCLMSLLLAACAPVTQYEHPITSEAGPTLDAGLVGHWLLENEDGSAEFAIEPLGPAGRLVITAREQGEEDEIMEFTLITAHVGSLDFASIQTHGRKDGSWSYYRYQLVGADALRVFADRDGAWIRAAKDRMLSSSVTDGEASPGITITASEKELREFVQGYGAVIFEDAEQFELHRK